MSLLDIGTLRNSERLLRRAHLVLAAMLHIYVQTQPPVHTPIIIPAVITVPLLVISCELALPPVLTYSDTVLYNWAYASEGSKELKSTLLLSGTKDEEHFYLTSAYIELAGVEALSLMQRCFDEAFVADSIALKRITSYLKKLSNVIKRLTEILDAVRDGCDPKVFYNDIRPWFRGEDSGKRKWIFVDADGEEVDFCSQRELSGPSAGQSTLIHALDVFLGVNHTLQHPHGPAHPAGAHSSSASVSKPEGFLERMQMYMPRHHRAFLNHLKSAPRPIRTLVSLNATNGVDGSSSSLANAYDAAVLALKGLRDAHIRIATFYIISQMPRGEHSTGQDSRSVAKGTGGSDLVPFLKGSRDDTTRALLHPTIQIKQTIYDSVS
jgi:indoleamine 2,3-dioxygenase